MQIPRDQIDPDAQKIIKRLVRYEHQAYLVGGCVRDLLLGRTPKDFDIATSATPNEIKELFRNCRIIGRRFRLAHIFFGSKIIETSTFRANPREGAEPLDDDVESADLLIRRDNVFGTAEEDARRRDFTINGLFYDLEADLVIDYVGGLPDLEARVVRTIGDPEIRFREDPVRILRAIKFAARLDFTIEPAAWQAILAHKGEIPKCAPPRVLEEIYRLLRGGAAQRSLELLAETGVLELLVPELAAVLGPGGDPTVQGHLGRTLDLIDRGRAEPASNAVLLCAIVGPLLGRSLFDERERVDPSDRFDEVARPILGRMRVSRRDGERARQILLSLRRLWPPTRRRRRPQAMARRDYFDEALQVFDLLGSTLFDEPAVLEEVARWRRLRHDGGREPQPTPEAGAERGEDGGSKKSRRRRRGGRRHRRKLEAALQAAGGAAEPVATLIEAAPPSSAKPDIVG